MSECYLALKNTTLPNQTAAGAVMLLIVASIPPACAGITGDRVSRTADRATASAALVAMRACLARRTAV